MYRLGQVVQWVFLGVVLAGVLWTSQVYLLAPYEKKLAATAAAVAQAKQEAARTAAEARELKHVQLISQRWAIEYRLMRACFPWPNDPAALLAAQIALDAFDLAHPEIAEEEKRQAEAK